ncbi:N-6 DNA methylase [Novosphingobium resinovorum]|uniref:N-6 DNA methylase n=1 Tax=Novosphingobium TaxID=165696 RepID=UPI001B3C9376|nr:MULTISPECIES: class I SAM-dependent methyltransferase [Novosphingobium]MBF7013745.1 N-6 DNA methylase [Novosphingobium sp. HR1a]WJM25889.1 N-6 DNA methylase [Novosphingobium resinovorum]
MEAMAIAISNSVDLVQREQREARYLEIVGRYETQIIESFARVMAELTLALESGFGDVLGALFHDLELHSKAKGQFFTPYVLSRAIADMLVGDPAATRAAIEERGYLTAMEPACGSGSMVIALAEGLWMQGINYQRHLHVTAVDIDPRAIHMAYVQLSLLHIPARLVVGDALSGEIREQWFTPAHILGGWTARLATAPKGKTTIATITSDQPVEAGGSASQDREKAKPCDPGRLPRQLSLF